MKTYRIYNAAPDGEEFLWDGECACSSCSKHTFSADGTDGLVGIRHFNRFDSYAAAANFVHQHFGVPYGNLVSPEGLLSHSVAIH